MALGTALLIGCASSPEPEAASPGVHAGVPEAARAVLPAWQTVDPAWFAAAEVWLVAGFAEGTYPCVQNGDEFDMIASHAFTPTRVLRGDVKARAIDVRAYDLKGASYPRSLAVGREYLVLLHPSAETWKLLADPQANFTMMTALGPDEVIAVVDLSRTEIEARAEATTAHRRGTRDGVSFTPEVWAAARSAATVTREQHAGVAAFVAATLLARRGVTTEEVRGWLGAPDREERWAGDRLVYRYWLSEPSYGRPVADGVYGEVELQMVGGVVERGELTYFRWHLGAQVQSSREIPAVELQARGLRAYRLGPP